MEAKIMAAAADGGHGEKPYTVLNEETIKKLVEGKIMEVSSVLRVSRGTACSLLLRRNWIPDSVFNTWVDDRHKIWNLVNQTSPISSSSKNYCKICMETVENMVSHQCGHLFCVDCWKTYITTRVNEVGPRCLTMPCPEPACKSVAGLDMVDSLAPPDVKDRYYKYLYRSYVELSGGSRKWCPAPGCDSAVEFHGHDGECQVACGCSHKFCWSCMTESHRPVDCAAATKWLAKDSSEADSILWILNNTKACPSCHCPIEKADGCNHLACLCDFDFCWECLAPMDNSHPSDGCEEVVITAYEMNRRNLERDFDKFSIWFERWDFYEKLRRRGVVELDRAKNVDIHTLARVQCYSLDELQCVVEAREEMVECRHLMKWSFVYGYYLSLDEEEEDTRKKSCFELLQAEAEDVFKRLQHCIEVEMKRYFDIPCHDFNEFRFKLTDLTKVTRNHFENFVRALENNLG